MKISDFDRHCLTKALHFRHRGYPTAVIARAYAQARTRERTDLLVHKPKNESDKKAIAMTRHHPSCHIFSTSLRTNWDILGRSLSTKHLYDRELVVAYRRYPNLREDLIQAKLPNRLTAYDISNTPASRAQPNVCATKSCHYCPKLDKTGRITSHATSRLCVIMKNVTCKKTNLISNIVSAA